MSRIIDFVANLMPPKLMVSITDTFITNIGRMQMLDWALSYAYASNLQGDYLEFGVYKGRTFALAYHFAHRRHLDGMRYFAFDSFKGLPSDAVEYGFGSNTLHGGDFAFSVKKFEKSIKAKGVNLSDVRVVEGWFDDVLNAQTKSKYELGKVAVAWVDCDLYASAVSVLEFITDIVVNGTVLVFDDWFLFEGSPDMGVQKATAEWLASNQNITLSEYHKFGWHGNSFIVRMR